MARTSTTTTKEERRQGRYQPVGGEQPAAAHEDEEEFGAVRDDTNDNDNDASPAEDLGGLQATDRSHRSNHLPCISIDDAIERLGMGPFQMIILLASGLCFAADAMQVILLSFLTLVLQDEWNLSDSETALLSSILFAGALVGTLVLGPWADAHGRRPVFLVSATIIFVFGQVTALCGTYEALLGALFCVGFGVGGLTVPFDILAECLPARGRGTNLLL